MQQRKWQPLEGHSDIIWWMWRNYSKASWRPRQLSLPGECPRTVLWDDLVIVRKQFFNPQTFLLQSLGPMPTLSIPPGALRIGIRVHRWLLKYPYRLTTILQSVLEPKEMKQRKQFCFFKQYPGNSPTVSFNSRATADFSKCRFLEIQVPHGFQKSTWS